MNKYYKAEDVERVLSAYLERSYVLEGIEWLSKRAIEVSEDCISRDNLRKSLARPVANYIEDEKYWKGWHDCSVVVETRIADALSVVPKEEADKSLKKQLKDIKTVGTIATEEEYGLFGCRFRTVIKSPSETTEQSSMVGEWIVADDESILFTVYKCSRCGKVHAHSPHNYCPNCGAKMKGADDE